MYLTGVNLGGWLITEPFIVPALYEKYQNVTPNAAIPSGQAVDEWSLSVAMRNDTSAGGGIQQLEDHYKTFIVRLQLARYLLHRTDCFADRGRLCEDCSRRSQLDPPSCALLGD